MTRFNWLSSLVLVFSAANACIVRAAPQADGFVARSYKTSSGATMAYRLFIPRTDNSKQSYPLIVYLHGGAGNGNDNLSQISGGNSNGSHVWVSEKVQKEHPSFVLVPQPFAGATWGGPEASELSVATSMMLGIIDSLRREFPIDLARLYITGQSLGGFGTWDVVIRRPDVFAAAVPLCGSGVLGRFPFRKVYSSAQFAGIKNVPIWVFQGADDPEVSAEGPRKTVADLRDIGSKIRYTEYSHVGHRVWERAYYEPGLIDWMFAQRRSQ